MPDVIEVLTEADIVEFPLQKLEIVDVVQKGDKGDSGRVTVRVNFVNQQTIQVNHNLGMYPIPMVFNANDDVILISPKHINLNRFDLIFNEAISGYVIY